MNTILYCMLMIFHQAAATKTHEASDAKALETLHRCVDVDSSKSSGSEIEALIAAIETLNPARKKGDRFEKLRHFWRFEKKGQETCFVLLEVRPGFDHPGWDDIRITILNSKGKSQFDSTFTTSMRCYVKHIDLESKGQDEFPIIILSTENGGPNRPGPDIKKQYLAKIQNRFDLIRLENSEHVATRNKCIYDHFRCGPPAPLQSVEDWQADLNSSDQLKNLRALTWLGAVHRQINRDQEGGEPEPDEYIKRVNELRALPSIRSRIKELAESKNNWIHEAAILALDPTDRW